MTRDKIESIIYNAIDRVNAMLEEKDRLAKDTNSVILGDGGKLDSLGLINFVVGLEQQFQQEADVELLLADQMMNAGDMNVFSTVGSLAAYIEQTLEA